jgi:hypothetical protein
MRRSTFYGGAAVRRSGDDSRVPEMKPVWTSASFLIYTGGLTVLLGGLAALGYLASRYGSGAMAGWSFLILALLYVTAHAFRIRGRRIAAGIFAFASVIAWAVFIVFLFEWFGWHGVNGSLSHWSWSRLAFWLLVLAAAVDDRRRFGFPFIRLISLVVAWLFVIDLFPSGRYWTSVLTLLVGLAYLAVGVALREPSSFWFQLVAGLLIGGPVLYWWHTSDAQWAIVSIVAFFYVGIAYGTRRSSWAVLGTIGFFAATIHYVVGSPTALVERAVGLGSGGGGSSCTVTTTGTVCTSSSTASVSAWSPALALGLLGFWLVLLGLAGRRVRTTAPAIPVPAVE